MNDRKMETQKAHGKHYRDGITLTELFQLFPDDATAEKWFVKCRWEDGIRCVDCESENVNDYTESVPHIIAPTMYLMEKLKPMKPISEEKKETNTPPFTLTKHLLITDSHVNMQRFGTLLVNMSENKYILTVSNPSGQLSNADIRESITK